MCEDEKDEQLCSGAGQVGCPRQLKPAQYVEAYTHMWAATIRLFWWPWNLR